MDEEIQPSKEGKTEKGRKETNLVEELPSSLPSSYFSSSLVLLPSEKSSRGRNPKRGPHSHRFLSSGRTPLKNNSPFSSPNFPFLMANNKEQTRRASARIWALASRCSVMDLALQCGKNRKILEEKKPNHTES